MTFSKQFDFDDAKDGAPIKLRFSGNVRILCWDRKSADGGCIVGLVDTPKSKGKIVTFNKEGDVTSGNLTDTLVMAPLIVIDKTPFYSYDRIFDARSKRTIQIGPRWKAPLDKYSVRVCPKEVKIHGKVVTPSSELWYRLDKNTCRKIIVGAHLWGNLTHYDRIVRDIKLIDSGDINCYSWEKTPQLSLID